MSEFFAYDKETLLREAHFPIAVLETAQDVFRTCAEAMIQTIEENNRQNKCTVLVLPLGPTDQYPIFTQEVNERKIDLQNTYFVWMDAYIENGRDLPYTHSRSAKRRADELVFRSIRTEIAPPEDHILHLSTADISFVDRKIRELGGIDLCVAGIGINGHIGFNEQMDATPEEYLAQAHSRILKLSTETRLITAINSYHGALKDIPHFGITLGLTEMLAAKKIQVYCFRDWHNACIKRAACDRPSGNFPATLLQLHSDVKLYCHEKIVEPIIL